MDALQRDILAWLCDTRTVVRWIYRTRQLDLAGVRVALRASTLGHQCYAAFAADGSDPSLF